jgi:competence protein ComEA
VLLAGGVVRLTRAAGDGKRPPPAASALADQRRALDSASQARRDRAGARPPATGNQGATSSARTRSDPRPTLTPVEVNRATAAELETLPRIGPALAARIIAERDANGPFPSLAALESRVRGIGPVLARTIQPHVRF